MDGEAGESKEKTASRDDHQQLRIVGVRHQLGLGLQPAGPALFHNGPARGRYGLVEGPDLVKVDLRVEVCLQRGREVVGVIMAVAVAFMVVVVIVIVVVGMRARHGIWSLEYLVMGYARCCLSSQK